jgi:O-antigen/teichoic acid export membrane protein
VTSNTESIAEQPQRSAGKTIARNTLYGVGAQLALKIASFLFNVFVINRLGGAEYGQYNSVLGWATLFSVVGDLGVTQYFAREVARDRSKSNELFWDAVVLRLILAAISSAITIGGALALTDYSPEVVLGIAVFTGTYFFQSIMAPLNSVLTGNERVDLVSVFSVVMQVVFMLIAGIFLYMGLSFVWLFVAGVINLPIIILLQWQAVRRNQIGPSRFRVNPSLWWHLLKAGIPFGLMQLSLSFAFRVDVVLLGQFGFSDQEIGWYSAAYINLTLTLLGISTSFNSAILPTLAREHTINPDSIRVWYYRSVKGMMFVALPAAIGGMLMADKIVNFLYPELAPAAIALAILVWDIPVNMYHSFCGNVTQSIKHENAAARIYGSLGVVNVILNLILIPRFGIIGAAFSTVLTDLMGAAQFYIFLRHEFGAGLGLKRLIRIGLSAVFMGVIVVALRQLNLFPQLDGLNLGFTIILAALCYLVVVWYSGAFSREERAHLMSFVTRRLAVRRPIP